MSFSREPWVFVQFGLIVTGKGERSFLPKLLRGLTANGRCYFRVIRPPIGQRSPVQERKRLKMVGSGKIIADRDEEEIGLPARRFLEKPHTYVLLVDDLEADRVSQVDAVFGRYRQALDTLLAPYSLEGRASVHFLVNMLEAYYFADAASVNEILHTSLSDYPSDVESIRHPKGELKAIASSFDEVKDGESIVARIDIAHVLSIPDRCAALRTLFAWCVAAMRDDFGPAWQLDRGVLHRVTGRQLGTISR